ncbi:MAG: hypothetical protein JXJ04_17795 [Spirochaetales bacterium]|nr:hypothetical protein [Spirochaetales bacterium]
MNKKVFYTAMIFLLLCVSVLRIFANPIPVPTLLMPEEWISVSINEKSDILPVNDNTLEAAVYGLYPMKNLEYEKVHILDPVPPKSYGISIALDGRPLKWTWSDKVYKTVLPEWQYIPQLEWTIAPVPEKFNLTAKYKHSLTNREDEIVFLYPMGCWKGQPIYSPKMTAHMKTRLPGRYLPKGVFLDNDPAPFSLSQSPDMESPVLSWLVSGDYQSKPYQALDRDYILTIMDRWADPRAWFSQPPDMADGFALPSMDTINTPAPADDFILPKISFSRENLGKLQFWGTFPGWLTYIADINNVDVCLPQPEYIRVCIYDTGLSTSNDKPRPGKLVYEYKTRNFNQKYFGPVVKENTLSVDSVDPGWTYNHIFSYNISFPRPFVPEPGKRYWISISSGPVAQNLVWSWVTSPVPDLIPGVYLQNNTSIDNDPALSKCFNLSFILSTAPAISTDDDISTTLSDSKEIDDVQVDAVSYQIIEGSTITALYPFDIGPVRQYPIKGSFLLNPALSSTSGSKVFKINNLNFKPLHGDEHLAGKNGTGTYLLDEYSTDPGQQRMKLSLSIGGNLSRNFDSGLVVIPETIDFPWIDIIIKNVDDSISVNSPRYIIHLVAVPIPQLTFSTNYSFTSGTLGRQVNDGDLLSSSGRILINHSDLISGFHLYPTFAEQKVGLDALMGPFNYYPSPDGTTVKPYVLFSTDIDILAEEDPGQGDILNNFGRVVKRNIDLISPFSPMPPIPDMGLDALAIAQSNAQLSEDDILPDKRFIVFSVEKGFFSERLGVTITPGDLLTSYGTIYRTNKELFRNFNPVSVSTDRGIDIDAVYILPTGEIWFSTATGFIDKNLGSVGHGDLLSENGKRVVRNLEIVAPFSPLEDLADFGLDCISVLQ